MKEKYMRATAVSFVAPFTMNGFTAGRRYFSNKGAYIFQHPNGDVFGISRAGVTDDDGKNRVVCLVETSIFNGETLIPRIEHEYDEIAVARKLKRYRRMTVNAFAMYARRWWNMSKKQARAWGRMQAEPFFYSDGNVAPGNVIHDFIGGVDFWEVDQDLFNDAVYEEMSNW